MNASPSVLAPTSPRPDLFWARLAGRVAKRNREKAR